MIWMPSSREVEDIHFSLVDMFNGTDDSVSPSGVKFGDLLESACGRPHTSIGLTEKYNNVFRKSAALFHSLVKNHAFHNGNKRTALITLLTVLHRNDRRLNSDVTDDDVYDFVVSVTENCFPVENHELDADQIVDEISRWIKNNSSSNNVNVGGMKTADFIERCKQAGVKYKEVKGGAHSLNRNGFGVRIAKSTRQLDGAVVRSYIKKLGLSETNSGVGLDEFVLGVSEEKNQIYRYMTTLKRLAKI